MKKLFRVFYNKFYYFAFGGSELAKKLGVNIGNGCRILTDQFGTEPYLINIGNDVTLTGGVRIITHDGAASLVKDEDGNRYYRYGKVTIGNNVFVGVDSIIMPNVTLGNNVIVGAGSIVTKSVSDNTVVAGSPARKVCSFDAYQDKLKKQGINSKNFNVNKKSDIIKSCVN